MYSRRLQNPAFIDNFIRRNVYFWSSLVVHLVLLYFLSNIAIKPATTNPVDKQVRLSLHNAYKTSMQSTLNNMAETERALVNTLDDATKNNLDLEPTEEIVAAGAEASLSQLLELARKISENIRKVERQLRANDLERAVTISHMDALKTVISLELAIPEYHANKMPGAEMVKSVEKLEENAKSSLLNRIEDMKARGIGKPLSQSEEKMTQLDYLGLKVGEKVVKGVKNLNDVIPIHRTIYSKNNFVDVWLDHIPPIDQRNPQKIAGRIIKDGAQYADRIFINSWYIVGPFPSSNVKHPPEYAVDLDGVYYGKDDQVLRWQYVSNTSYPLTLPQINKSGVFFGYTEIILDRGQDLWVWVGADDFASLRLNDTTIWESAELNKKFNQLANNKDNAERNNWNLTEYKRLVHFKAGKNSFKFKLTNSDAAAFFSLVITH